MTGKLWFGIAKLGFHKCQFCYLRVMRIHLIRFRRDKEMAEAKSNGKEKVIYRNKRKENACLVDKEMAEAKSKGKEKVIYTNKRKEKACPVIEYHREKNVGVVIREEWDRNLIRLNMDTNVVEAMSKGKANLLSETKGKENAFPLLMILKTGHSLAEAVSKLCH